MYQQEMKITYFVFMTLFLCLQCGFLVEFLCYFKSKAAEAKQRNTVSQVINYLIHQGQRV